MTGRLQLAMELDALYLVAFSTGLLGANQKFEMLLEKAQRMHLTMDYSENSCNTHDSECNRIYVETLGS